MRPLSDQIHPASHHVYDKHELWHYTGDGDFRDELRKRERSVEAIIRHCLNDSELIAIGITLRAAMDGRREMCPLCGGMGVGGTVSQADLMAGAAPDDGPCPRCGGYGEVGVGPRHNQ